MKNAIAQSIMLTLVIATFASAGTIEGKVNYNASTPAASAVVYVGEIKDTTFQPPSEPVIMDQKNLTFIPHILPILIGTKVGFKNSDDVLHNVFTPSAVGDRFNLGTYPKGETRYYTFKKLGAAVILCQVHPEMEAWVVVLPTPYFTKAGDDGSYKITDVPEGNYTVEVWYEKTRNEKPAQMSVKVPKTGEVTADFTLVK
jgi:plastocyanin